jgi:hypothetical protein
MDGWMDDGWMLDERWMHACMDGWMKDGGW